MPASRLIAGKVSRWETPFCDALLPSVLPFSLTRENAELVVVVSPNGVGRYPAYEVEFESAPCMKLTHEMNAPPRPGWVEAGGFEVQSCAYKWENSPFLEHSGRVGSLAIFEDAELPMQHFVLAGGDWVVDVLSTQEPKITEHWSPFTVAQRIDA